MMKSRRIFGLMCILLLLSTQFTLADDWYGEKGEYFKVYTAEDGELLFETAREVSKGDQYLSRDNKRYNVVRVNTRNRIAYAEFVEDVKLPEIDEEAFARIQLALQTKTLGALLAQAEGEGKQQEGQRRVGIYATHSSESYKPTDGTESQEGGGGIFKVADQLRAGFEENGVEAIFDNTSHDPHDAGAYKRSRRTALQMLREKQPTALVDVHRDAIPAEAYITDINGEPATMVRLVVGRRNQNFKANEEMAMKVKAVADKMHPELIKDIFYAKGDYNQDLTPRAMLVEMGTYSHTRQRAERSANYLSEVLTTAFFGGTFKDEKEGDTETVKPETESNEGSGAGMIGLLAVIGAGGLAFLFLSSGGKEWKSKVSNFKQEFYNFLGRTRKKK